MKRWFSERGVWMVALTLTATSYAACAWLWAAPYRTPVSALPTRVDSVAPQVVLPAPVSSEPAPPTDLAPVAAPLMEARPVRTPALTNTRNFLIMGLDRRPDGTSPALADSLVVVVLDEASEHVGLVSIPRDLYVDIPDAGSERINTVYQVAKRTHRDPLALMSRVVEDTLKLPIEHVVALDLGVFERAVDAVGGVDVQVPCPIRDDFVDGRAEGGRRVLDLDEGPRHLDGVTAAMYARSRHGRSDFHRARRQQAILLGVQRALSGLGVLKVPELLRAFESSLETDLRRIELLALARRGLDLDPSHLHGLVLGHDHVFGFRTPDGKSVLLPRYDVIDASLGRLLSAPSPGARPTRAACERKDAALRPS
jgi:LCP family protein required for cell wall assembly